MKIILKSFGIAYFIISLVLLFYAPEKYSKNNCMLQMCLFLIFSAPQFIEACKRLGIFNFYTFFYISFFCINYLHACFIYPNDSFLISFSFPYNSNNICKGLSMASLCAATFILGSTFHYSTVSKIKVSPREYLVRKTTKISLILVICLFLYVFFILRVSYGIKHLYPRLMLMIVTLIILTFYYKVCYSHKNKCQNIKDLLSNFKIPFLIAVIFSVSLLRIGSRANVIFLWMGILAIINTYVYRFKISQVVPLIIVAVFTMAIITLTRVSPVNLSNSDIITVLKLGIEQLKESPHAVWIFLKDFIVNSRTLYDSIDFVNQKGYLYGESFLQFGLVFIPGGGSFLTWLYLQKEPKWTNTDNYLIEFTNSPYGMGTNMVGDMYMNVSIFGLIIFSFLLGALVKYSTTCNTKYRTFLYISLIANSVYLPRASMLGFLDLFFLLIILDYFLNYFFYHKRKVKFIKRSQSSKVDLISKSNNL